jgi:hypothetical protein
VFRRHNIQAMENILPHWQDLEARTKLAISARDQLERQMEGDRKALERHGRKGWHTDPPPDTDADTDAHSAEPSRPI